MQTKDLLKKYWFVGLVCVALLVFVGVYAVSLANSKEVTVSTKQVDGKDLIYSIDDLNYTADELYEELYSKAGLAFEFTAFTNAVLDKSYETTEEMTTFANNLSQYYWSTYGADSISAQLASMGYGPSIENLRDYYISYQKNDLMMKEFFTENFDEYVQPMIDELSPRKVSHILVKVADVTESKDENGNTIHTANPTAAEKEKIDAALEALKTKDFAEVAKLFSEDGSAANGGSLGIVDQYSAQNFVEEFRVSCMELEPGEVSEVITTAYGYHIIKAEAVSKDELLADDAFVSEINDVNPYASVVAVLNKAEKVGYEIKDEKLQSEIDALLAEVASMKEAQ